MIRFLSFLTAAICVIAISATAAKRKDPKILTDDQRPEKETALLDLLAAAGN